MALLEALAAELPGLTDAVRETLTAAAAKVAPLVCNWDGDALEEAMEASHHAAARIDPELLSDRSYLGIFKLKPAAPARAAFQHSVLQSIMGAEALCAEIASYVTESAGRAPALKMLLIDLHLETDGARRAVEMRVAKLDAFDADLQRRFEGARTEHARNAILRLAEKSSKLRQDLGAISMDCRHARRLHTCCERVLRSWQTLADTLVRQVEPAWVRLCSALQAMQTVQAGRYGTPLPRRQQDAAEARADFESGLTDAMGECAKLHASAEEVHARVVALKLAGGTGQPSPTPLAQGR